MVNLLITMRCNRSCSYCFAKEKIHSYSGLAHHRDITLHDLDKALDFLARSGCDSLQLAGGEPTIHPEFDEILIRILRRDMNVNLLSNALWNPEKNELFSKISPVKLGFLLNIDHPDTYRPTEWARIEENLLALEDRGNVTLSFNIFEREPRCEYIFDLASKHGFTNLRLSFSMPVVFDKVKNVYLPIEEYKALTPFVVDFVRKAETLGTEVRMDNTVPICMFSKDELAELLLKGVIEPRRNLTCFPAVDIGPDLSLWRCFGTSGLFNMRLEEFKSLSEVYEYFERMFRPYQFKIFPMKECYECRYARESLCQGGCIGFSIAKCMELGNWPQEFSDEEVLDLRPKLSANVIVRNYDIPKETLIFLLGNRDLIEVPHPMKELLDLFNGRRTVRDAIDIYMQKTITVGRSADPLDDFLTSIASEELIPSIRRLLDRGFLILHREDENKNQSD